MRAKPLHCWLAAKLKTKNLAILRGFFVTKIYSK